MQRTFLKRLYGNFFFHDRFLLGATGAAILINAALWFIVILSIPTLTSGDREYITLHYRIIFGTDFIAGWPSIFLLPSTGMCIFIINAITASSVFIIEKRLGRILCATSVMVQVLLLASLYFLIRINLY